MYADYFMVGDAADTWVVVVEVGPGKYENIKANRDKLQQMFQQDSSQARQASERTIC